MRIYSNIREIIVSLICIAMFTLSSVFASDRVVTYPIPEGIEMNPDFTVEVSADGKNWQVAPSYPVKVAKSIAIGTTTESLRGRLSILKEGFMSGYVTTEVMYKHRGYVLCHMVSVTEWKGIFFRLRWNVRAIFRWR